VRSGDGARIGIDEAQKVAALARIALSEAEAVAVAAQLNTILDHFAQLAALDTADVPPTSHPIEVEPPIRADEVCPSLGRDRLLAAAPQAAEGCFTVPKVID
jgi:aspartyl-tRNA(Asn)/glutamyl-tRNA(Gln) amidotransferase subunit C